MSVLSQKRSALWNGAVIDYVPGIVQVKMHPRHRRHAYATIDKLGGTIVLCDNQNGCEVAISEQETLQFAQELGKSKVFLSVSLLKENCH